MNRIREFRKARGMTLDALAREVRITVPHLSRMEKGERPLTDVWMGRLAPALGVQPHDLMASSFSGPGAGEFIKDPDEIALVRFWRSLDRAGKQMVARLMTPPAAVESTQPVQEPPPRRKRA